MASRVFLAVRSVLWAIAFPGFFTVFVPWTYFGLGDAQIDLSNWRHLVALACIAAGAALLAACIFEFARSGRGTLSPLDPPRQLVVRGLYRYVRNPMYLSVTTIVLGEVLLTGSHGLALFWVLWFLGVNIFVMAYEEPVLRRKFGPSYEAYTRDVRRWIPTSPMRSR